MDDIKLPVWPPDYNREYSRRMRMLEKMRDADDEKRALIMAYYKDNPAQWIEDWCITFNPRSKPPLPKYPPFLLFPKQREFVQFLQDCIRDGESGLVEKCRDIGATWLCVAFSVHQWLFVDGSSIGWGSRKQDLVDRIGVPDSIFEKIRMLVRRLPVWMMPEGFTWHDHSHHMRLINPVNGSTIAGEAGDNIGRGGRSTIYFKDESAHYENPETIEAALGDNTDVQIDISSVKGTGNVFYRRRKAGEIWTPNKEMTKGKVRVFIFDWRDHPAKDQAWYDQKKKKMESEGLAHVFAQETDRDYTSAVQGIIIPQKWVQAAIDAHIKLNIPISGERVSALDVADGDNPSGDKHAQAITHGILLKFAQDWGDGDGGEAGRRAIKNCILNSTRQLYYDCIGVGSAVKSETNRMTAEGLMPQKMVVMPWSGAWSPLDPDDYLIAGDQHSPTNGDYFKNFKSQAWWRLRVRFEKTYKAVTFGAVYPHDELISLDSTLENLHEICAQLSQATHSQDGAGKVLVNKYGDGESSPNLADSIVMVYNPAREVSILDVVGS